MDQGSRPIRTILLGIAPVVSAALAVGVGFLVLVGWKLGVTELIRIRPGLGAIAPSVALALILAGGALRLLYDPRRTPATRTLGVLAAATVTLIGGLATVGASGGLDRLFVEPALAVRDVTGLSAFSLVVIGASLVLLALDGRTVERMAALLTVTVSGTALFTLVGYLYGADAIYSSAEAQAEPLHAAVVFLALGVGVACARPNAGVVRLLRSETGGGQVARRILTPVVVLPVALGWGVLRGAQLRGYDIEFGVALYTILIIGVLATLVWGAARALADSDRQRLAAEEALKTQEEQYRRDARFFHTVLDSLPDGVTATDLEGRLILWNLAADPIVRLAPAGATVGERIEAYGAVLGDGSTPVTEESFPMTRALAGETVSGLEMVVQRATPPASLSISASPLRATDGSVIGAVGVFRDISERRALEAQLFVADRLASVGLLAAGVAHEINNPLAVISGNLQLLGIKLADAPGTLRMVTDSAAASERIRQIVKDLRTVSGADSEKRTPLDLRSILEASVRVAANDIRQRARVVEDYQPVARVLANEARMGQVFLNLVMNAAAAIPEGAADRHQVRVRTMMRADGKVVVEVSDTGSGILPEHQARLFTPFFTTKPIGEGSGLGLSICHRLVAEVGGDIEVNSTPGAGSTFRVVLPAMASEAPVPLPANTARRVLVVDDEPDIRALIQAALAQTHEVHTCASGAAALAQIAADPAWGVILVDLMMPGMSGIELWRRLAAADPRLADRVVFLSGGAYTAEAQTFLREHGPRYLEKPFDLATLRRTVTAVGVG